jgi:hypothetical protein
MALEFICSNRIVEGKRIALPREPFNGKILKYKIHREIDSEKREIAFFYANNRENDFALNTWIAPKGANEMKFTLYKEHEQNILNAPVFYDDKGEILKIGNR